jgi:hypothetical protein
VAHSPFLIAGISEGVCRWRIASHTALCGETPSKGHSEDAVKSSLGLVCEHPVFTGDHGIVKCIVEPSEDFKSKWYDTLHLHGLAEVCLDERRRSSVAFDVIDEPSPSLCRFPVTTT